MIKACHHASHKWTNEYDKCEQINKKNAIDSTGENVSMFLGNCYQLISTHTEMIERGKY